jgi:hypothetical protein
MQHWVTALLNIEYPVISFSRLIINFCTKKLYIFISSGTKKDGGIIFAQQIDPPPSIMKLF